MMGRHAVARAKTESRAPYGGSHPGRSWKTGMEARAGEGIDQDALGPACANLFRSHIDLPPMRGRISS